MGDYSFYQAHPAPAPDWGALVHANLAYRQRQLDGFKALMETAAERQRLRQSQQHHEDNMQHQRADEVLTGQRIALEDRRVSASEDAAQEAQSRFEDQQSGINNRAALSQMFENMRNRATNDRMLQMHNDTIKQAQNVEEDKRQKLLNAQAGQQAYGSALSNQMSNWDKNAQEFTASDLLGINGLDPVKDAAKMRSFSNSTAFQGSEDAFGDFVKLANGTKFRVPMATPGWHDPINQSVAGQVTAEDQARIFKQTVGDRPPPTNPVEARQRALEQLGQHPVFKGMAEKLYEQQKPVDPATAQRKDDAANRARESLDLRRHQDAVANAARKAGFKWDGMTDEAKNAAIESEKAALPAPAQSGASSSAGDPEMEAIIKSIEERLKKP